MPLYFFNLKSGHSLMRDFDGTELEDDAAARVHAETVAREIMRNNEVKSRYWRLQVCNSTHAPCFEVLFAALDQTIDQFPPNLRETVRTASSQIGSLCDAIEDVRMSIRELRATMARTGGSPYLAAVHGRRIAGT